MVCICIGIISGYFINSYSINETFGILLISPAIMSTTGNIGSIFGSKLTTALHSGIIGAKLKKNRILTINFMAMIILILLMSALIGCSAYIISLILKIEGKELTHFLMLTIVSGLVTSIFMILISIVVSFMTFSRGLDPDNFVTPIVTTLADFLSILIIIMVNFLI